MRKMIATSRIIPVLALAFVAACNDGPTAVTNGAVSVVREGNALRISNGTNQARAFMAYDANWLAVLALSTTTDLSMVALCTTTDATCLRLPAHGSALVPFSNVGGYSESTREITVWTWRVLPSTPGGALEPVLDQSILVKL